MKLNGDHENIKAKKADNIWPKIEIMSSISFSIILCVNKNNVNFHLFTVFTQKQLEIL